MPETFKRLANRVTSQGRPSSDYDLNSDIVLPAGRKLRPAAVLIAIADHAGQPHVILTMRSSALKHHPGQIAFPGGKVDGTDAGPEAAALREAQEEVGLPSDHVDILGTLPSHETVTGFTVSPIVGRVTKPFTVIPEPGEVDEVFMVPLDHVLTPENFSVQSRRWRGVRRHYYTVPFGPYYIWGATARILRAFCDQVNGR